METIIADKFAFGGNCIAKLNGKNVFVPFAIPGEKLEIEITEQHRDYDLASITKILEPSPKRIVPACPHYYKCGGCNMMHIDEKSQIEFSVEDNGAGFTEERLKEVRDELEKGEQDSEKLSSVYGLYNVNKKLRLYYGDKTEGLKIESEAGKGSRISFIVASMMEETEGSDV